LYAANDLSEVGFNGNFAFHRPSPQGSVEAIVESARGVFTRYLNNRKVAPKNVFVFRNDISEGMLADINQYEVHGLRMLIKEVFKGNSTLVYLVCNKKHNVRLTPSSVGGTRANEQNLKPGVVVDEIIVHPSISEFYLLSHSAQQGTAKVPRYTILANDAKLNFKDIEETTFHLCFCHQIINSSVSLPSPVYIAEEYAKRARNVYNSPTNRERVEHAGENYALLTAELSFVKWDDCRSKRVNA